MSDRSESPQSPISYSQGLGDAATESAEESDTEHQYHKPGAAYHPRQEYESLRERYDWEESTLAEEQDLSLPAPAPTWGSFSHQPMHCPSATLTIWNLEKLASATASRYANAKWNEQWQSALREDDLYGVRTLVENGFDFTQPIDEMKMPLHDAVVRCLPIAAYLLENGAAVDGRVTEGVTPLEYLIRSLPKNSKNFEGVIMLLSYGANVGDTTGTTGTALQAAVRTENAALVQLLLRHGADVNRVSECDYDTALTTAVECRSICMAKLLLDAGANPDTVEPLVYAVITSQPRMIRLLLEHSANSGELGPLLVSAAEKGDISVMQALLEYGADIDFSNDISGPALQAASYAGHNDAVLFLLLCGASKSEVRGQWDQPLNTSTIFDRHRDADGLLHLIWGISTNLEVRAVKWNWEVPALVQAAMAHMGPDFSVDEVVHMVTKQNVILVRRQGSPCVLATTYWEYVKQSQGTREFELVWEFILELLDLVVLTNLTSESLGFSVTPNSESPFDEASYSWKSLTATYGSVTLNFSNSATLTGISPYLWALDLLCRTLHGPRADSTMTLSNATYRFERFQPVADRAPISMIMPTMSMHDSPIQSYGSGDCWRPLFNSCVVSDLSERSRTQKFLGEGLEISFELMVSLAGVEFPLDVDGGIVFVGYQTVLYPTVIGERFAQFHLIANYNGQINPYTLDFGKRVRIQDPSRFKNMRCYLGWCEAAQINLGTENLPADVKYSGGKDQEKSLILEGHSTLLQFGIQSPVSIGLGIQTKFSFVINRQQFAPSDCYSRLLQDTARELAMVYDASHRRCWLLPKLSLLLHMCQAYRKSRCLPDDRVPFVHPHADGVDIIQTLEPCGDKAIHGAGSDLFAFRQLILGFNINLLSTRAAVQFSSGKRLYGFEFLDVVTSPGRGSCMKRLELISAGKSWLDLVNVVDAVVVCSDLGEAITPVEADGRQNAKCNAVPKDRDYMAATLSCLHRLVERKGGSLTPRNGFQGVKVTEESYWHLCGDPFQHCQHDTDSNSTCWKRLDIIQRLESARRFKLLPVSPRVPTSPPVNTIPLLGAVVFGERVC